MSILSYVYEKLTGRPWLTTVSCTEQLGPTPGAVIHEAFGDLPDYVLFHNDHELLLAARKAIAKRQRAAAREASEYRREADRQIVAEVLALRANL